MSEGCKKICILKIYASEASQKNGNTPIYNDQPIISALEIFSKMFE